MAVFTELSFDEVRAWLEPLAVGELRELRGVQAGIENTNYFVDTDGGHWVLTVFERLSAGQLPFYLRLIQHLARHGMPVPEPRSDARGEILHRLKDKPAALCSWLPGRHVDHPTPAHCVQLGATLARLHRAAGDFALQQPNLRGLDWWLQTAPLVRPFLATAAATLLDDELQFQQHLARSAAHAQLPRAAVHADLFRDNVMFDADDAGRDRLSGCIDFYFAGVDTLLFDLAVCVNDWCIDSNHHLDAGRAQALLSAYLAVRPFTDQERAAWPWMLRAGALRFWVSRLYDFHLPRPGELTHKHDPERFRRILMTHRAAAAQPAALPA